MPQKLEVSASTNELIQGLRSGILDMRMARMRMIKIRQKAAIHLYDFPEKTKADKAVKLRFSEYLTQLYNAEVFLKEAISSMDAIVAICCERLKESRDAAIKELALEAVKTMQEVALQKIGEENG